MSDEQNQAAAEQPQVAFNVSRIFTKDISFETPNSPAVFQMEWKPEIKMDLDTSTQKLAEGVYEVTLSVTVTATLAEEKVAFLCEVEQAGIFEIQVDEQQLPAMLGAVCPNMLFPYARETVSNLVNRGSFPPLNLAPVDFHSIFAQYMQQRAAQQQAADAPTQ